MSIVIFILVLIILILVHELGHFLFAKWCGIRVDEFGLGFPPRIWVYKPKGSETLYSINAIPFGGFVKIYGEDYDAVETEADKKKSFVYQAKWKQTLVLVAGVFFNILLAWLLFSISFMGGVNYSPDGRYADRVEGTGVVISNILEGSPASVAGLQAGDKIITASSVNTSVKGDTLTPEGVTSIITESGGDDVHMILNRGGKDINVSISPSEDIVKGAWAVGISMIYAGTLKLPIHLAIIEGARITGEITWAIVTGFADLIKDAVTGKGSMASVVGPVGIAGLVGDAAGLGFVSLISFMAMISLHLAVLNLIPFPALDGGRILFVIIEKIKGSPMNAKIVNMVNLSGFLLLILFLLFVTYKDIVRLF